MANVTKGGFRPWGTFTGGQGVYPQPMRAEVASGYATALCKFDPIKRVADGTVELAANGNTDILGIAVGFSYVQDGKRKFANRVPASTTFSPSTVGSQNATYVHYIPATPDVIFVVDADDGTTVTTVAGAENLIGENADHATGTGDTVTGVSGAALDISDHKTTTAQWRIVGPVRSPDNDVTSTRAKYLVACNEGGLHGYTTSGV